MAFRSSIGQRRSRKVIKKNFELQLTSLLDVLVIILVFLLKTYQTSTHDFTTVKGIQIPYSKSSDLPSQSLQLIVTPEAITFENERVVEFVMIPDPTGTSEATYTFRKEDLDEQQHRVRPLFDALEKAKMRSEQQNAALGRVDAQGQPKPFDGILAIQADKRVTYETLRRIMYTAGAAGYRVFRFLGKKQET